MRQTITFTEPQAEWLKAEAARLGVTVSEVVRRAVTHNQYDSGLPSAALVQAIIRRGMSPADYLKSVRAEWDAHDKPD